MRLAPHGSLAMDRNSFYNSQVLPLRSLDPGSGRRMVHFESAAAATMLFSYKCQMAEQYRDKVKDITLAAQDFVLFNGRNIAIAALNISSQKISVQAYRALHDHQMMQAFLLIGFVLLVLSLGFLYDWSFKRSTLRSYFASSLSKPSTPRLHSIPPSLCTPPLLLPCTPRSSLPACPAPTCARQSPRPLTDKIDG